VAYPTVVLFTFSLSRRMANVGSILLLLIVSALVYHYIDRAFTIRFSPRYAHIIFANIVLSIIVDLHRRLLDQAVVDPLTGVFNRRHMERSFERRHRTAAAQLHPDLPSADGCRWLQRSINDQFGHAKGDSVLKEIVSLIAKRSRKLDLLFRIGGEEFMLLLPDTKEAAAAVVAEQLRASTAESRLLDDRQLTLSIGVSELQPGESRTPG